MCINCRFVHLYLQFYYSLDDISPKPVITVVLTDIDFLQTDENFGDLATFQIIFTHIFTARAQKQVFLSFRLQLWQRHWIQRPRFPVRDGNFSNRKAFTAVWGHILCSCTNSALFVLPVRNLFSLSFSATSISYKGMENFAIWLCLGLFLGIFLLCMRRNSYFWASSYNYDNAIGFSDPDFL